jgi:phage head maturation protease
MNLKDSKLNKAYAVKEGLAEFAVKDVDSVGRVVTGFFNTFNYFDTDGDVLMLGSAKKSIQERGPLAQSVAKIKHAMFHDLTRLPGKIQVLEEREQDGMSGIYFETKMSKTTEGMDALQNYLDGVYDNHSIGFKYINIEAVQKGTNEWAKYMNILVNPKDAEERDFMFIVKEIALYEGSTVAFGANTLTPFLGVKSGNKQAMQIAVNKRIEAIGKTVKSGSQSDDMLYSLELQLLQLKQLFQELHFEQPVNVKDTLVQTPEPSKLVGVDSTMKGIDYNYLLKNFKL